MSSEIWGDLVVKTTFATMAAVRKGTSSINYTQRKLGCGQINAYSAISAIALALLDHPISLFPATIFGFRCLNLQMRPQQ